MFWYVLTSLSVALFFAAQAPMDETKKDHERLQGTWKLVYSETDGKGFKPTNDIRITFDKNTTTEWSAGELASRSPFKIDSMKKPRTMDVTIIENRLIPESKGTKIPCIYDFDKDRLKLRYLNSSFFRHQRPTEFPTKEGSGGTLHTYEKVKGVRD